MYFNFVDRMPKVKHQLRIGFNNENDLSEALCKMYRGNLVFRQATLKAIKRVAEGRLYNEEGKEDEDGNLTGYHTI